METEADTDAERLIDGLMLILTLALTEWDSDND